MAGELSTQDLLATTGLTLYAIVRASGHRVALGAALEVYNAAHWTSYAIAGTDRGAGYYDADMPALAAGVYWREWRQQAGGSPAITDIIVDGAEPVYWDGTALILPASRAEYTAARAVKLDNLD